MTNYDEGTQDEPVADTPAVAEPVKRPTILVIALEAVFTGIMAGVLAWLVAGFPEEPRWWDWAGVLAYAGLTGAYLWALVKLLRRRWAKEPVVSTPPVAYLDQDGDQWYVQPSGLLALSPRDDAPGVALEEVRADFGPLTPIQD